MKIMDLDNYKKNKLVNKVKNNLNQLDIFEEIECLILFGSRAREDHDLKSDLDLAFLLNSNFINKINEIDLRIDLSNFFQN